MKGNESITAKNVMRLPIAKNILLVGLSGRSGAGKSFIAARLEKLIAAANPKTVNIWQFSFAYSVKIYANGLSQNPEKEFGLTKREMYQIVGTDFARNMINKNIWVMRAAQRLKLLSDFRTHIVIFDDVRFPNEIEWIARNNGITCEIVDPEQKLTRVHDHASERQTLYPHFQFINNHEEDKELLDQQLALTLLPRINISLIAMKEPR